MVFVINNLKYNTEKMKLVSENIQKWYKFSDTTCFLLNNNNLGRTHNCKLYKSGKGSYLLVRHDCGINYAEKIEEDEAKKLLIHYDLSKYEELFGELEEG